MEAFVKMMNEKAEELGLTKTHFVTPNGLDGEDEGGVHATNSHGTGENYEILYYGFSGKGNVSGYYRNERIPFPGS